MRVGIGVDVHKFSDEQPLMLAGLEWPDSPGLAGHSDADVAAHAAADAMLSAAGLGDLGTVIGIDSPQWAAASGAQILTHVAGLVREQGYEIVNVAIQIIGNQPRFAPRRAEAEATLSAIIGAPVAIGATTTDGMGLTGRGEGLAAMATALLS